MYMLVGSITWYLKDQNKADKTGDVFTGHTTGLQSFYIYMFASTAQGVPNHSSNIPFSKQALPQG